MRRAAPLFVVVFGVLAVFLDFVPVRASRSSEPHPAPRTRRSSSGSSGSTCRAASGSSTRRKPVGDKVPDAAAMNTIRDIIERRVNATGVSEPIVYTVGPIASSSSCPGVQDARRSSSSSGTTGRLDFVPLPADRYGTATTNTAVERPASSRASRCRCPSRPLFSGDQIDGGQPGGRPDHGKRAGRGVHPRRPRRRSCSPTTRPSTVNEFFAIVLDGNVVSAPFIESRSPAGTGQISGSFGGRDMNNLVTVLRYGSLPFPIQPSHQRPDPARRSARSSCTRR